MTREYLQLKNEFWSDPYIESLPVRQKLLYLYLLTKDCLSGHQPFEISERKISFETGIAEDGVSWMLCDLEKDGQISRDGEKIRLVNAHKYVKSDTWGEI